MSTVLLERMQAAERQLEATDAGRAQFRVRLIKLFCMAVLGVCFWYSVPYYLPLKVDPNPAIAAANEAAAYEGNFSRQVSMPVIALVSAFLLWRLPRRGRMTTRFLWVVLAYCAWVFTSYLWSIDPAVTGKRLIVFAIDAGIAYALARTFSMAEMAVLGFSTFSVVALLSFYVDTVQEQIFRPFDADYRFTGVMTANYQAMNLLVAMMCGLTILRRRPQWAKWILPVLGWELGLLYLTRARLSAVLCVVLLAILSTRMLRERLKPQMQALALLGLLAVAAPALIYVAGSKGSGAAQDAFMMGRKDTENTSSLSNRAPLWAELWESVMTRPLQGFGYAGFWAPERVEQVSYDQGWMVPNAHDTYLDQTLSLGLVGAFLYTAMLWGGCVLAWRRNSREQSAESLLPAILLTWLSLTSVAESVPLDPYLPSLLAYTCLIKMAMAEGSERETDAGPEARYLVGGGLPTAAASKMRA